MRTALALRSDILRAQLYALAVLSDAATPGPWDTRGSFVIAREAPVQDLRELDYYGGALVAESLSSTDAAFVSSARNVLPDLARDHIDALDEIAQLRRHLRFALVARIDVADGSALIDLFEACGFSIDVRRKGDVRERASL